MTVYSSITMITFLCVIATQSTWKNKGVSWNEERNLWQAEFYINGEKHKSYFDNEFDASKKLNELCDKMTIPSQNPEINLPNESKNKMKSQYRGVYWHRQSGKWQTLVCLKKKQIYGGHFNDELDAAKRVNQLCEKLRIPFQNPTINAMPNQEYQKKEKTSKYIGVYWHKKKKQWQAVIKSENKQIYGGHFNDELDAAKRVNQVCENLGICLKNPTINAIPNQQYQKKEQTSQYKGVSYDKLSGNWQVLVSLKGQKKVYGGRFKDELDAAKRANQLCENLGIPFPNPTINAIPNQQHQEKEKNPQYKGVNWNNQRKKWYASLASKDGSKKFGGYFDDKHDAAKRVNQLCEEFGIAAKNPGISGVPNKQSKEKTSQYKGVCWKKNIRKWYTQVQCKGGRQNNGGYFIDELEAAKRVNQLCEELGIPLQNPTISAIPDEQYQKNYKLDCDAMKVEFENLIKILDENNDPIIPTIKENLIMAANDGENAIMEEVNLRTKNGESLLSISAKYGFSNIVKFLISKGAEKEHFTNENHTPLSLAVYYNHLKVVQVLFENWISPNSHENPYLHLSPIFNVKSREIAQLLIDNDAVTHGIYNDKNQSPLTVACQNGYLNVVEFFLDDGLDINHLDNDNKTPLFYALTNNHHNVANLLISKGSKNRFLPNQPDKSCEQKQKAIMSKCKY